MYPLSKYTPQVPNMDGSKSDLFVQFGIAGTGKFFGTGTILYTLCVQVYWCTCVHAIYMRIHAIYMLFVFLSILFIFLCITSSCRLYIIYTLTTFQLPSPNTPFPHTNTQYSLPIYQYHHIIHHQPIHHPSPLTDTHWMCKGGAGSWNWRCIIPIELPIANREEGRLNIQMMERNIFTANTLIGANMINMCVACVCISVLFIYLCSFSYTTSMCAYVCVYVHVCVLSIYTQSLPLPLIIPLTMP